MSRPERKFDPSNAERLDRPERQSLLPNGRVIELLELEGSEVVVDYGAGSGVLTVPLIERLSGGEVHAVDESEEMLGHLETRVGGEHPPNLHLHHISDNRVELPDGVADRVLAVNLLHEVVGERALAEMRRLLKPGGFLLVIDWDAGVELEQGPPSHIALTPDKGREMLEAEGFSVAEVSCEELPAHYVLKATPV